MYIWWFLKWFLFDYSWEKTKFENIRILLNGKNFAASHFCKLLTRNLSTWNRSRVNHFLKCVLGAEICRKTDCIKAISCVDTVNCGVTMTHWKGYGCRSHYTNQSVEIVDGNDVTRVWIDRVWFFSLNFCLQHSIYTE